MCGIAGVLTLDGEHPDEQQVRRMGDALRHRGPDAEGLFRDTSGAPALSLIHRRLSIIDLSTSAHQPLGNEDGSVQVALNGEIYNFQELRQDLSGRHTFRSQGDTEVIAHLYEERGPDAIAALDGMFAIALWDSRLRRLLLARDPFGKKPLFYWFDGRRFVFGSEIKALFAAHVPAEMEDTGLGEYLGLGYVPSPRTFFRGILKVPPASFVTVDSRGVSSPHRYWDLPVREESSGKPVALAEATANVRELLTAAVRKRLVADVPLGVLLSGGIDSSAVAALTARQKGGVRTYTVGFAAAGFQDERAHAEIVARHIGADHHASVLEADAAGLLDTTLHHFDEPLGDTSAIPTYLVAGEARRHVTVALNGDGGDEVFAGYARFHAALIADRLPATVRQMLRAAAALLPDTGRRDSLHRRIRRFAEKAALPLSERLFSWSSLLDIPTLQGLDGDAVVDRERLVSSFRAALDDCAGASPLSTVLYVNARTYLLDDLLPKMDRMTMAHALEARSPLLDRDLAEYVARLPDSLKRSGGTGKVVLREAVKDLLPPEILDRPKRGFDVPVNAWLRGALRPLMEDMLLANPRLGRRLKVSAIRRLVEEHVTHRADWGGPLWNLLVLERWMRRHNFD